MTKSYLVVYAKGKGDAAGLMGYSPDVPQCVSCGDTLEEMRTMMTEALEFHLEGLLEDGLPIPEPQQTTVYFDPGIRDEVERYYVEWLAVKVPNVQMTSRDSHDQVAA